MQSELMDDHIPCGHCNGGIYSQTALIGALPYIAKEKEIPRCKSFDRICVGLTHACGEGVTVTSVVEALLS